jgi:23S rRNA pseudouridine1911/1915/1917 synthase
VKVGHPDGKPAETLFRVLATLPTSAQGPLSLIEARPLTGRTHQIRAHLAHDGLPVCGDPVYGPKRAEEDEIPLGLRAIRLIYADPFTRSRVWIGASYKEFLKRFGFGWLNQATSGASPAFLQFVKEQTPHKPSFPPEGGKPKAASTPANPATKP